MRFKKRQILRSELTGTIVMVISVSELWTYVKVLNNPKIEYFNIWPEAYNNWKVHNVATQKSA